MEDKIENLGYLKSILKDEIKREIIEELHNKLLDSPIIDQFKIKNFSNDIVETIDKKMFDSLKDCDEITEIPCIHPSYLLFQFTK